MLSTSKTYTKRSYSFDYPVTHKVVRNLRIENECIGLASVNYEGAPVPGGSIVDPLEEQFQVEVSSVSFNGQSLDINLLNVIAENFIDDLHNAALNYMAELWYSAYQPITA